MAREILAFSPNLALRCEIKWKKFRRFSLKSLGKQTQVRKLVDADDDEMAAQTSSGTFFSGVCKEHKTESHKSQQHLLATSQKGKVKLSYLNRRLYAIFNSIK